MSTDWTRLSTHSILSTNGQRAITPRRVAEILPRLERLMTYLGSPNRTTAPAWFPARRERRGQQHQQQDRGKGERDGIAQGQRLIARPVSACARLLRRCTSGSAR
jgi:hypothetical protein